MQPAGNMIKLAGLGNIYLRRNSNHIIIKDSHKLSNQIIIIIQRFCPVILTAQQLALADLKNCKAYKLPFAVVGNIVAVIRIKTFYYILILQNHEGFNAVAKSGRFFKVQSRRSCLHFGLHGFYSFFTFSLK